METPLPYKDFTIKARVDDLARVEQLLQTLEARYLGIDQQVDTYFKTDQGKLKWRHGTVERLITHYERYAQEGVEKTRVYRYDREPSEEQIRELFQRYEVLGIVKKQRRIYYLGSVKIHLDMLENGESFVELEAFDRSGGLDEAELMRMCSEVQQKLEIKDGQRLATGYFS